MCGVCDLCLIYVCVCILCVSTFRRNLQLKSSVYLVSAEMYRTCLTCSFMVDKLRNASYFYLLPGEIYRKIPACTYFWRNL